MKAVAQNPRPSPGFDVAKAVFLDAGGTLFRPVASIEDLVSGRKERDRFPGAFAVARVPDALENAGRALPFQRTFQQEYGDQRLAPLSAQRDDRLRSAALADKLHDVRRRPDSYQVLEGTHETLARLKDRGMVLGVVSNWDSSLVAICEGLGLHEYFDFILSSFECGHVKPDPEIFRQALARSRTCPEETVHVGDDLLTDVRGALRAHLRAVWLRRAERQHEPEGYVSGPVRPAGGRSKNVRVIAGIKELLVLMP
jgi:putative hydrolase of the HAD superfamily